MGNTCFQSGTKHMSIYLRLSDMNVIWQFKIAEMKIKND